MRLGNPIVLQKIAIYAKTRTNYEIGMQICRRNKTVKASSLIGCTNYDNTDSAPRISDEKTDGFEIISEFFKNYASVIFVSVDNLDVI